MSAVGGWRRGPVVAWTEADGPGELPRVPSRRIAFASVVAAGVAAWGLLTADEVCPEHSMAITIAATLAILLTAVAVVAAFRASVMAAPLVLAASVFGLSIGVVDVMHDATRSRIVAIGFAVAAVAAGFSAVQVAGLRRWEHRVLGEATEPLDLTMPTSAEPSAPVLSVPPVPVATEQARPAASDAMPVEQR